MADIGPSQPVKCDRYYTDRNKTTFIYGGYEGIPETLLINFCVWLLLLILFGILRKLAWDYGRIALVSRRDERETLVSESRYNVWTSLFYTDRSSLDTHTSQESLDTKIFGQDKGFCGWLPAIFKIKDEHYLRKSGRDAVQYLIFQRHLLVYTGIICILSIGVILPINFQGTLEGNTQTFGHTTISNINSNSPTLWVHALLAIVFLVIAVYFMRHFSINLRYEEDDQTSRSLMISGIPKDKCFKNLMQQHFQEAYPEVSVLDIQFAYNIGTLIKLDKNRQRAYEGKINSENIHKETGERPEMVPKMCGQVCCCCSPCGCRKVDAIMYYTDEENKLREQCEQEKVNAFRDSLGIAFVTFDNDFMAARIFSDFKTSCKGAHNPQPSTVSTELEAPGWEVKYAPAPDNIFWENLSTNKILWWTRAVIVNCILVVLLFFLTTPSILMNLLDQWNYKKALNDLHSAFIVQFLPTVILWTFSALLPNLVYYAEYYLIGHWTRSGEHHAVMRKTFIFLLLMVIVLPSLGLTSAKALLEFLGTQDEGVVKFRWQCIFLPDNGAFFVNYVITSAFIGSGLELIRFPELFMYALRLLLAKSAAEQTAVRKHLVWEFQFGIQYAWMLCIFAVIVVYSIPCPLIVPFGLLYLILKHLVDRYNIYFAYGPSKIDKNIHTSAINFVIVAVIMLQFCIVFFTVLRSENTYGLTVFSLVALFLTLIIFVGRLCFGWFKGFGPLSYSFQNGVESPMTPPEEQELKAFVPNVLLKETDQRTYQAPSPVREATTHNAPAPASQSYGATDSPSHEASHANHHDEFE
ncbi:unnamed protein product [Owenia fusiformis]|uniref:CSC1-like protein 2 n=1 Tax=Owenia fusiformis TaxID=6347 RepID=A0A8S4PHP3_OWEFU|nr:unnamed protein product [Owenia fusiformis]